MTNTMKTTATGISRVGLGCGRRVADSDGTPTPAPDGSAVTRAVGDGTADHPVGVDEGRRMVSELTGAADEGSDAIGMTQTAGRSGGRPVTTREAARRPGTAPTGPGTHGTMAAARGRRTPDAENAKGRRANADPIACPDQRDACAVLKTSPALMS